MSGGCTSLITVSGNGLPLHSPLNLGELAGQHANGSNSAEADGEAAFRERPLAAVAAIG